MFTMMDTDGFTQAELDGLNEVAEFLRGHGVDDDAITDTINNVWQPGDDSDAVLAKSIFRLEAIAKAQAKA